MFKITPYLYLFLSLAAGLPKNKSTRAFNKEDIFLGDATESQIKEYYGDFKNYRKEELINYLYSVISKNNNFVSYNDVSKWYKITDRNYDISNPIQPEEYDFSNDEGASYYTYNMYFSSSTNNDISKAISNEVNKLKVDSSVSRVTYSYTTDNKITGFKPNSNIQVDKEHVWPKNKGFKLRDKDGNDILNKGAPTDLHNLVAADHNTNSSGHSDYYYGNVINKTSSNCVYAYSADGEREVSGWKERVGSRYVFEPTDEWKGNVARCLMYMATRYSNKDSRSQQEPYLVLSEEETIPSQFQGEGSFIGEHINLSTILKWHEIDPVDKYEIHRNNLIYFNVQNNRNPYIDYPELAQRAFSNDYDFSLFKEKYNIHIDDEISFNITLPNSISQFVLQDVVYDSEIIRLEDNKKVFPLKEGSSDVIYHIVDTENNSVLEFKTTVNIKSKLEYIGPTSISLKSFEKYNLNYEVKNLHEDEVISYENSTNLFKVSGNTLKVGLVGKEDLKIDVKNSFNIKRIATVSINVKLSALMIIIFVFAGVILIVGIGLGIFFYLKKKKKA